MKKLIALLLAAVMCLSLAACGKGQTTDNSPQDTDEPSNAELTEQTVEITLDNWQDYFEFRPDVDILENSYNEITGIKDNIMESYGYAISSVEITRIKGTFTILQ